MATKRRQQSDEFKFRVALEADKGLKTVNEIAVLLRLFIWRLKPLAAGAVLVAIS